jgi:hypothetical protein
MPEIPFQPRKVRYPSTVQEMFWLCEQMEEAEASGEEKPFEVLLSTAFVHDLAFRILRLENSILNLVGDANDDTDDVEFPFS